MRLKILFGIYLLSFNAIAGSMTDQINAFANIEKQININKQLAEEDRLRRIEIQIKKEKIAENKRLQKIAQKAKNERIRVAKIAKRKRDARNKILQIKLARQKVLDDRMMADKKRNQNYEDQMRNLNIAERQAKLNNSNKLFDESLNDKYRNHDYEDEKRKLELSIAKAKASRVNEYIDMELKKQNAETDVVQSHADGIRNITNGKHLSKSFFN